MKKKNEEAACVCWAVAFIFYIVSEIIEARGGKEV